MYNPIDHLIYKELDKMGVTILDDTPYSLLPVSRYQTIMKPGLKKYSMAQFQRQLVQEPQLTRYKNLKYTDT